MPDELPKEYLRLPLLDVIISVFNKKIIACELKFY